LGSIPQCFYHIGCVKMPYSQIKKWRDDKWNDHQDSSHALNDFHDELMMKVFDAALERHISEFGPVPCRYTWFVMGSAGRFEQAIISDQDHGLIYEERNEKTNRYFITFGKELANGLNEVGYPYCDGNVMSSNPVWSKSIIEWEEQLSKWLTEESFESIRFLLIFYDARVLIGEEAYCKKLKQIVHDYIKKNPRFLERLLENTQHVKKAVGFFHQFLTEPHGAHAGSIELKQSGFFPYVNNVRLLAMKESLEATSTLARLKALNNMSKYKQNLSWCAKEFEKLLHYRLQYHKKNTENYDDIHYLNIKELSKDEKKEMKHILLNGQKLQEYTQSVIKGTIET
jgi:CBS domain-containing protein